MDQQPDDYIDVNTVMPVNSRKLSDAVDDICRRFYDQQFTASNVLVAFMCDDENQKIYGVSALGEGEIAEKIRARIRTLIGSNVIKRVGKSNPGRGRHNYYINVRD